MNPHSQKHRALVGLGAALALALTLLAGAFILVTVTTTPSANPGSAEARPDARPKLQAEAQPEAQQETQAKEQPGSSGPNGGSSSDFGFAKASKPKPSEQTTSEPTPSEPTPSTDEAEPSHNHDSDAPAYDPLGTGAEPGDLSQTDKDRLRIAVMHFAQAAYGYTGDDPAEYEDGVSRVVVLPDYYESPGAKAFSAYGESVRESGGVESSTVLQDFEITKPATDQVTGVAKLLVSDTRGETDLTQKLTLVRWGAVWRVQWADELKEDSA